MSAIRNLPHWRVAGNSGRCTRWRPDPAAQEVFLHFPGVNTYHFGGGFENGGIFQDLGVYQNFPGGCLAYTGGSGESVDFSFNTISSALSNYKCIMKIKIKNTNVSINKITFSPTYA